jgi:hypothetical protein
MFAFVAQKDIGQTGFISVAKVKAVTKTNKSFALVN